MNFKIAGAPGAWGIEDANNPHNPPWSKVLDEASRAGYKGIELGPFGYLPQDIKVLKNALEERDLQIVAGTLYDDLVSPDNFDNLIKKTHITCELISQLPKIKPVDGQRYETPYFVIIDQVHAARSPFAGQPLKASRLPNDKWDQMMNHIREISKITAQEYGIRSVVHPHAGGYIEHSDEIVRFLNDIPAEEVGLCLDTGHLYYSCMNPEQWLKIYADRLDYIHFKDINKDVYDDVIKRGIDFFEACKENVMCPIGQGVVDYAAVYEALLEIDYRGWITIEQERDPKDSDGTLADVTQSLNYLTQLGY